METTPPPAPRRAALAAWFDPLPPLCNTGQPFAVRLTVSNQGEARALGVYLSPFGFSGPPLLRLTGPATSSTLPLGAGEWLTFTWTCAGTEAGVTGFSVTVTAVDEYFRRAVWVCAESSLLRVTRPARLSAVGELSRTTVSAGQWVVLKLTVSNTGEAPALHLVPQVADASTAELRRLKGPTPPGPVTLAGGRAARFAWGWLTRTPGGMAFMPGVTGVDGTDGNPLAISVTLTGRVQASAALTSWIQAMATGPNARCNPGQRFGVRMTVLNEGEAELALRPPLPRLEGLGRAKLKSSPPAELVTLPGAASRSWTWTYEATAPGPVAVSAVAVGREVNTDQEVPAPAAPPARIAIGTPRMSIGAFYTTPAFVDLGDVFTVYLTVTNTGAFALEAISPRVMGVEGAGQVGNVGGPLPVAMNLPVGSKATFMWQQRAMGPGTVVFRNAVVAWDGTASAEARSNAVVISSIRKGTARRH